jgi:toxin-antitoxin system PIN domain toxin
LLDVNLLVALFDPDHVHHEIAHDWFADHRKRGWATCPLTENGFIRTAVALSKAREPLGASDLADHLRTFTSSGFHEFWEDEPSVLDEDLFDLGAVFGHQLLTDVYLLGLAVTHKGVLATFDRKIPLASVKGATAAHLAVLAPRSAEPFS